jgi:hypothetical protein
VKSCREMDRHGSQRCTNPALLVGPDAPARDHRLGSPHREKEPMTANQTGQRVIGRDSEIDAGGVRWRSSTAEPPAASAPLQHGKLT